MTPLKALKGNALLPCDFLMFVNCTEWLVESKYKYRCRKNVQNTMFTSNSTDGINTISCGIKIESKKFEIVYRLPLLLPHVSLRRSHIETNDWDIGLIE